MLLFIVCLFVCFFFASILPRKSDRARSLWFCWTPHNTAVNAITKHQKGKHWKVSAYGMFLNERMILASESCSVWKQTKLKHRKKKKQTPQNTEIQFLSSKFPGFQSNGQRQINSPLFMNSPCNGSIYVRNYNLVIPIP